MNIRNLFKKRLLYLIIIFSIGILLSYSTVFSFSQVEDVDSTSQASKQNVDGISSSTTNKKKLEKYKYAYLSNIQDHELSSSDLRLKNELLKELNGRKTNETISYLKEKVKKIEHENLRYFLDDYLDRKIEVEMFVREHID